MRRRVVGLVGLCAALGACTQPAPHVLSPTTTTTTEPTTTTTTDPGVLPQTDVLPSGQSAAFEARMAVLWAGIVDGSASEAQGAFFPESAYVQVKDVADPSADYRDRLQAEFALDVGAAHDLVGAGAATLVGVVVPSAAHWVPPGTCFNRVGYYEVPNSRIVYDEGGAERSFGIASLISWRGEWYVVHLGAVLRSGSTGVVDAPAAGAGVSAPSSTC